MRHLFPGCLFLAITQLAGAQTASNYIAQGRADLAVTNIIAANASFSNAVALSPTNEDANVLYAATRLLVLPSQPAGSNFLSRLGLPVAGRNIYDWTAELPEDSNGVPLAPAGVNADEATSLLRTNVLPVLIAADANLAMVTDTNYTLSLTSAETRSTAVTIDYGDIQMFRAMAQAGEGFIYNTYDWNLNVQLTAVRSFYNGEDYSIQELISNNPSLFVFTTTNDLAGARAALTNAADSYLAASQFIRGRPPGETRLFNLDNLETNKELQFRLTLADLENSLGSQVVLRANPNYVVHAAPLFSGAVSPRPLLPQLQGRGFVAGSWPDVTFGGTIFGDTIDQIEPVLAIFLTPYPQFLRGTVLSNQVRFPVDGVIGHGYVVQESTNPPNWSDDQAFISFGSENQYQFTEPIVPGPVRKFYRVEERTANIPQPPNNNFTNRIRVSGLGTAVYGYDANALTEPGDPALGYPLQWPTVWWTWTSPYSGLVVADASGSISSVGYGTSTISPTSVQLYPAVGVYTGSTLPSLVSVGSFSGGSFSGTPFQAVQGTTYQIQVGSSTPGGIKLVIGTAPILTVTSPVSGTVYSSSPANITINASVTDVDATITNLQFTVYATNALTLASTTNSSLTYTWTGVGPGYYYIDATATDSKGITAYVENFVQVNP